MNANPLALARPKLALGAAAALVTALFALTAGTPKAAADSFGCTWAPFGNVCILIEGHSTYVSHVRVRRAKIDPSLICNYRGVMTIRNASGKLIRKREKYHSGCSVIWAWFDWYPRRHFPHNSTVCTAFYEYGQLQGRACNKVLR
jgi:hypothetical protein